MDAKVSTECEFCAGGKLYVFGVMTAKLRRSTGSLSLAHIENSNKGLFYFDV
jgi:hypothetical protein